TPDLLKYSDTVLNRSTYQISYGDKSTTLSGREFQIAEMLMQNPCIIISTEQLITHIWGWEADVDTSVVWVHISNLRKKLESVGAPIEIRFVRGAGYIMEAKK
ncbi:MAG: winged helix-turn-helix transcriptional regulator, partial [Ruminiclostridium sp.]|nr:winged helix-turn-helix transcriptional regulator [Ruminiclostridium sp.]